MIKKTMKSLNLEHKFTLNSLFGLILLLILHGCAQNVSLQTTDLDALKARYEQVKNTEVADSAPMEMRFINEKLDQAYQALSERDVKMAVQLTEQIELDFKIVESRARVNQLNDQLLDLREKISESQLLLSDLEEQLK